MKRFKGLTEKRVLKAFRSKNCHKKTFFGIEVKFVFTYSDGVFTQYDDSKLLKLGLKKGYQLELKLDRAICKYLQCRELVEIAA